MARTSSALSVYLMAAGFRPPLAAPEDFKRHLGDRLWVHVADPEVAETVPSLIQRLADARGDDPDVIVSGKRLPSTPTALQVDLPRDRASDIRATLQKEEPSVALFLGLDVPPSVIYGFREAGARTLLVASPTGTEVRSTSRILAKPMFRLFDEIAATDDTARGNLIRLGTPQGRINVVGRLDDASPVPDVEAADQEHTAKILGGRPLWLAANAALTELRSILDAQRIANSHSHRMLLVIAPDDPADAEAISAAAEVRGYSVAMRSKGEEPEDHVQIYLADIPDEIGLWYRLAPITFVGNSLAAGTGNARPDGPAALGSAIIYGAEVGPHRDAFDRLAALGGARMVSTGKDLGATVSSLLAPDKPAAMAHAAWLETSKGAEGTERVVDLLMRAFDDPEGF